jgi:hypothetical protein
VVSGRVPFPSHVSNGGQRLIEIGNDVVGIFNAHRDPNHAVS